MFLYQQGRLREARASIERVVAVNTPAEQRRAQWASSHDAESAAARGRLTFRLVPPREAAKAVQERPESPPLPSTRQTRRDSLSEQLTAGDVDGEQLVAEGNVRGQASAFRSPSSPQAERGRGERLLQARAGPSAAARGAGFAAFWAHVRATPLLKRSALLLWTAWFTGVFGFIGLNRCVPTAGATGPSARRGCMTCANARANARGLCDRSFLLIVLERRGIFSDKDLYKDTFIYAVAGLGGACTRHQLSPPRRMCTRLRELTVDSALQVLWPACSLLSRDSDGEGPWSRPRGWRHCCCSLPERSQATFWW